MWAMPSLVVVKAAFDAEAGVWYVESSDLPGLNLEAASLEELRDKAPAAVLDLLDASDEPDGFDVPIEIIAHASTRTRGRPVPA